MDYFLIHDWEDWQSFRKDRGAPPWIKIHRSLMTNQKWAFLSDSEKGQLISIWIVAADNSGKVPASAEILKKVCLLDGEPNIKKFIQLGLLAAPCQPDDNQMTAPCQPDDAPEERRGEERREEKIKEKSIKKEKKKSAFDLCDFSLWPAMPNKQVFNDWVASKKRAKGSVSQTAMKTASGELHKLALSGVTVDQALSVAESSSWRGFKASWIINHINEKGSQNESNQRDNRSRAKRVSDKLDEIIDKARRERLAEESQQRVGG